MWGFKSVLLTKSNFETLEAKYFQKFEAVISHFLGYVELKAWGKDLLFGKPKMGSSGILQAKNVKKILWNF